MFDFVPKMLVLKDKNSSIMNKQSRWIIILCTIDQGFAWAQGDSNYSNTIVSATNIFSWYSENNAEGQANTNSVEYYYLGIG